MLSDDDIVAGSDLRGLNLAFFEQQSDNKKLSLVGTEKELVRISHWPVKFYRPLAAWDLHFGFNEQSLRVYVPYLEDLVFNRSDGK